MPQNKYKLIFFSSLLMLFSCNSKPSEKSAEETFITSTQENQISLTKAQFEHQKMQFGSLVEKPFPNIVNANGTIDVPPENRAIVNATMGGYIKTTPLLIGDKVKKGQVLVTIENPEFVSLQQKYLESHSQLPSLEAAYKREQTLFAEKISSEKNYLKAESDYKTMLATYKGIAKQLQLLNISKEQVIQGNFTSIATVYAPISGSITKVNVSRGSYVSPSTLILEIINNDHIHLELSLFEKDIMQIKKGQEIVFSIPEASSQKYKATVHLVGTALEANRTVKVHGHINDEDHKHFLTGMFIEAAIVTASQTKLALPSEAVVDIEGKNFVLILDKQDDKGYLFHKKEVKTTKSHEGFVLIENAADFNANTQFLTQGAYTLLGI
ncbi:hemolysin D [Polaribacter pacificus]|uniref:Hemolysin D n=1 Tax=Polaribacter pacificus TaxID=1775173 RepID=A0A917HYG1_9FLAO|nr:efflux RND transporter periplasmic adaptor subunit [Polaribacter pacificus]GGG95858.1 hemolysin D [Polaribacter pacificus]